MALSALVCSWVITVNVTDGSSAARATEQVTTRQAKISLNARCRDGYFISESHSYVPRPGAHQFEAVCRFGLPLYRYRVEFRQKPAGWIVTLCDVIS